MIKVNDLMKIERVLLEIETKYKFELDFNDAWKLHQYLVTVGKITSYAFLIQDEYSQKYSDINKLKQYHERIMNDFVEVDNKEEIKQFIGYLQKKLRNDELDKLILSLNVKEL